MRRLNVLIKTYFQNKKLSDKSRNKILHNMYMAQANGSGLVKYALGALGAVVISAGIYFFATPQGQEKLVYYAPASVQVKYVEDAVNELQEVEDVTAEVNQLDEELQNVEKTLEEVDALLK